MVISSLYIINAHPDDELVRKCLKVEQKILPQNSKLKPKNVATFCHRAINHAFKNTCDECPEIPRLNKL